MVIPVSVLCPIDFSDHSRAALRWAAAIALRRRTNLVVLSVVEPLLAEAARIRLSVNLATEETEPAMRDFIDAVLSEETRTAVGLRSEVVIGRAAPEIMRAGRRCAAVVTVMGTHGRGGIRKLVLGSTTEQVLRLARRPILALPAGAVDALSEDGLPTGALQRVLVATDFSDSAWAATQWAVALASEIRIPLVLSHVVEPVVVPAPWQGLVADFESERVAFARRLLAQLSAKLGDVESDSVVSVGPVADTIASLALQREAGLVVMGLTSRRSPGRGRPGSIAYRLLRVGRCPVVVVPTPDRRRAQDSLSVLSQESVASGHNQSEARASQP
jgi:nucleotide-binding universal stress UspA family protein